MGVCWVCCGVACCVRDGGETEGRIRVDLQLVEGKRVEPLKDGTKKRWTRLLISHTHLHALHGGT